MRLPDRRRQLGPWRDQGLMLAFALATGLIVVACALLATAVSRLITGSMYLELAALLPVPDAVAPGHETATRQPDRPR